MPLKTTPFSLTELVPDDREQAQILGLLLAEEVLSEDEGDPKAFLMALGRLAREKGMADTAKAVGVTRERLYKSLSGDTSPRFSTVIGVLAHLGYQFTIVPSAPRAAVPGTSDAAE